MSFCQIQFSSPTLGKAVGANVILPDVGEPPFPVLYLLHGLSDDYTIWHRRTRIEWYVRPLPLIVVMPDGFRGFYTNNEEGPAYADFMARELPDFVERNFSAMTKGKTRCVGGLSMGGYGAMRLALGFPDRYVSATSHSGALAFGNQPLEVDGARSAEFERIIGAKPIGTEHDLFMLAERCHELGNTPALRIDCGVDDFLLESNRSFTSHLAKLGVEYEYEEFPGNHSWDYWDEHVQEALAFHCRHLGIEPL